MLDYPNKCCPYLEIVKCGDTDEHKHFMCNLDSELPDSLHLVSECSDDWDECVSLKMIPDDIDANYEAFIADVHPRFEEVGR